MKYTKNLHNKLLLAGFEFRYEFVSPPDEDDLYYAVYQKGFIEVSVCDSHKEVQIYLRAEDEDLSFLTLEQVMKLDKLINRL